MKPGVSAARTGVLPRRRAAKIVASATSELVRGPATTSTSAISGTGLKKCIPTTRSGRSAADAIRAIERLLVLVARIVVGVASESSRLKTSRFSARSSGIASTSRSTAASSSSDSAGVMWARASAAPASSSEPFSTLRRRNPAIRSWAR